jgi:hypothetical protein
MDKQKKIKEAVKKLKNKKRAAPDKKETAIDKEKRKQGKVAIGPRGGEFKPTRSGKKEYVEKGEKEMKKALTAGYDNVEPEDSKKEVENIEASADLRKPDEEAKEEENKEVSQEAATEKTEEDTKVDEKAPEASTEEGTEESTKEEPKSEPKFAGGLFNKNFSLGSTLAHQPSGVSLNNIKPSKIQAPVKPDAEPIKKVKE